MGEERSRSGAAIKRYGETLAPSMAPPEQPTYFHDIVAHLESFLGPIEGVDGEIESDQVQLLVLPFRPTEHRSYWTLVTCGMSTRPMAPPAIFDDPSSYERAELIICLPENWFGSDLKQLARDGKVWPIEILRFAARFPHLYNTWVWIGHTLSTEEPPEPFDPNTEFCAFAIAVPLRWPKEKWKMVAHDRRSISFLTVIPLYRDELQFKLDNGTDRLLDLFDEARVNELFNPTRPSLIAPVPPKWTFPWSNLLSRKTRK
jgi:Suppressor of fused protein (SUFU)